MATMPGMNLGDDEHLAKVGSVTQRSLLAAWLRCKDVKAKRPGAVAKGEASAEDAVLDSCLSQKALTCSAQSVAALSSGRPTSAHMVRGLLLQAGSAVQQLGGWLCGHLFSRIQTLCSAGGCKERAVAFVHAFRYDETPHAVRISSTNEGQLLLQRPRGSSQESYTEAWLRDVGIDRSMKDLVQAATHAKVVQVEHRMACLMQDSRGKFAWVSTDVPAGLCAVDRTTGENMRAVLWDHIQIVPEVQRLWAPFGLRIRLSTADRAGSNNRAEVGLQEPEYMEHFVRGSFACDTHKTANAMKACLRLADPDMSGVLNLGLVSAEAGALRTMRAILIDIFRTDLQIRYRAAPQGAIARHRKSVLDTFVRVKGVSLTMQRRNLKRQYILQHFLNDDWNDSAGLVHNCNGCCVDEGETRQACSMFLSWALMPTVCPLYSRKSWTRSDESVDYAGLLASCHGLLRKIYLRYTGNPAEAPSPPPAQNPEQGNQAAADPWLALLRADAREAAAPASSADPDIQDCLLEAGVPEGAAADAERPESNSEEAWQQFKRQKRKLVSNWVCSRPAGRLAVLSRCIRPMLAYLANILKCSGRQWDKQQQHAAAVSGEMRSYPILEAARGDALDACLTDMHAGLHGDLESVAPQDCSAALRCLRFRVLASGMSSLHALLRLTHRSLQFQIFRALERVPENLELLSRWPVCMRDELSAAVLERYPDAPTLAGPEAQCLLEGLATFLPCNIAAVECVHAKNREHTLLRSRGWLPTLETISAKHLFSWSNHAQCQEKLLGKSVFALGAAVLAREYHSLTDAAARLYTPDPSRKRSRCCHLVCSTEELLRYKRAGEAATEACRQNLPGFGERAQRTHQRRLPPPPGSLTASGAMVALDDQERIALYGGVPFLEKYNRFKQQMVVRHAGDADQALSKQGLAELKDFAEGTGKDTALMQDFAVSVPVAPSFVQRQAVRAPGLLGLHWQPPIAAMVQAVVGRQNEHTKRAFKVTSYLMQSLKDRCKVYHHDQQKAIQPARARQFVVQRCQQLGVCVCGENASIGTLCTRMKEYLRATFNFLPGLVAGKRVASKVREKLKERMVVLHWQCIDADAADESYRRPSDVQASDLFWHLGHVNLTSMHVAGLLMQPWQGGRQEVLQLVPAEPPARGADDAVAFSQGLRTDAEFVAHHLDLRKHWIIHVCFISLSEQHWTVEDMTPVPVIWSEDVQPFQIWGRNDTDPEPVQPASKRRRGQHASASSGTDPAAGDGAAPTLEQLLGNMLTKRPSAKEASAAADAPDPYLDRDTESQPELLAEDEDDIPAAGDVSDAAAGSPNHCSSVEEDEAQEEPEQEVGQHANAPAAGSEDVPTRGHPAPRDTTSTVVFETQHGTLRYYPQHAYVTAFCSHHLDCRRSRTVKARAAARTPAQRGQGRCLGALCAWLQKHAQYADQNEHVHHCFPTAEERCAARDQLYAESGGKEFASNCERERREGEDEEPAVFR
ncbi:unnamed protein product [Symbiodinium sp. CCMP2592]|nr:unnamed protein product [Symbiodinium sp. CCMP2592]